MKKKTSKKISSEKKEKRHYKDPLRHYHPATSVILSGYRSGLSEYSIKAPLFRTSTFEFSSAEEGALFFKRAYHLPGNDGKEPGLVYSRLNNPNSEIFEDKIIAAEVGATHSLLFPSGMSAISTTILALIPKGGKILYTDPVYGGTYLFFKEFCPNRFSIDTYPVDTSDLKAFEAVLKKSGKIDMVYLETPANPTLKLTDISGIRKLVDKYCGKETLIAVDNTFMGPVFQKPFELGADIILYSATKFLGGHSDLISGVVLTKDQKHFSAIRDFRTILGATPAPDSAWLLTRSIETLWVRMERQAEKAMKVAKAISKHPKIKKVIYPGLLTTKDGDQYKIYKKQCIGPGSMITFYLKNDSREKAFKFLNGLEICHLAVSLGGTESLIEHPRSMTHSDMTLEDLDRAEISEGMIRLSVGLESSDDLIEDLKQALDQI
ncbi:MAG: PLP-dependent aspartate aminotransferase family protein [Bacteriovoracaceae bacterium]|nr:PLP-dependent aspartate aminotransferase family protein [Bacteriovoracaceae bacterium]